MKAICPNCGSDEIIGADHVLASAYIADWEKDDGAMRPIWVGETEVHWGTQEPVDNKKPYCCTDCGSYYAVEELKFVAEGEEESMGEDEEFDHPPRINTGHAALTDQQREDAEDLS